MSTEIISAIIIATGAIISQLIVWILSQRKEEKSFSQISDTRIEKLHKSVWKGEFHVDDRKETEMSIVFSVKKKRVQGVGTYIKPSLGETKILFEGGFVSDNLLKLNYKNSEEYKLHFGAMILEMNGNGSKLVGGLLSYGRSPDKVYHGEITLWAS